MMRKPWGGLCAVLLLAVLIPTIGMSAAESLPEPSTPVRLVAVKGVERPTGTSLEVQASGRFSFTSYQPHARNVVVDLAGVVSEPAAAETPTGVSWVSSYRLLPFRNASGRPVLRLDIALERACTVSLTQPGESALLLSCPTAPAAPTLTSGEPVLVRQVVVRTEGSGVIIDVQASGRLDFQTLSLTNPTRLVLDLPQSILATRQRQLPVDEQAVVGVRLAQFKAQPPVTRLVVDLREMVPYDIQPSSEGLRLSLGAAAASARPAAPAEGSSTARAEFAEETPSEPAPTLVASLAPVVPSTRTAAPTASSSLAPEATLVASAASPAPAVASAQMPAPGGRPAGGGAQVPTAAEQLAIAYTGEPISVNLKDVDLKDFFRLIHEISGLNIVIDPNVSGSVTLVLIDVPWDQALDIVLRNNGLSSTLEGNVLRIATRATLKKEQEENRDLAKARAEAVDPITRTIQLSYARGNELEPTLKRFLSSRGELIRDDRTNTLIIRDIPSVIPPIENLIKQLDRKSLQVEIEARVVLATRAFTREFGSQLGFSTGTGNRRSVLGGALGPSPFGPGFIPPPLVSSGGTDQQPLITNFPIAATSGILFGNTWANLALDVILTAAESRSIAKILSRPRLVTQNNVQAEVKQGSRIPVQTQVNNTISTQFIDALLRLNVKPQVTAEGTVFLDITIENSRPDFGRSVAGIPSIDTQQTTTQVLIPDGSTVVIGGVMVTDNSTSISQVPLLGSIPVIGHLFKSTRVSTTTSELLFFITPRILPG
ncbi:MAG: type IV pilus secretin PilQ [Acidobacteria bacterium]|nr:type IV pilus secretin PilQ [Acidobacteriota bacterium]